MLLVWAFCPLYAFTQVHETFTGPEITSQNPWQGETNSFFINSQNQLQFTSPANEAGETFIYLPIEYAKNMTWDISLKLDFSSTQQNNLRIYAYASGENSSLTAYFIQVGNNDKQISFYSIEGTKQTLLIAGRKGLLDEPYPFVHIRLTLEANKTWTLHTRRTGESGYAMEGTYTKAIQGVRPGGQLNLYCRYVKARISTYYFDQLHIYPYLADFPDIEEIDPEDPEEKELPELTDMEIPSLSEITFIFDRPVDISEAVFHISGIGDAIRKGYGALRSIVHTRFPAEMTPEQNYRISWKQVKDEQGNTMPEDFWDITLTQGGNEEQPPGTDIPDPVYPEKALRINEIMADPKGLTELPETEYVELYNTTDQAIPLKDWQFIYDNKITLLEAAELPPNGYVTLYREGREIHIEDTGIAMPLSKFPVALANAGKQLQLKDPTDKLIDEIYYPKAKAGKSWERDGDELYLSTDPKGGTPGKENSRTADNGPGENPGGTPAATSPLQKKELIFNELLPEPFAGGEEYIELYNRSGKDISLQDLYINKRKTDGSLGTFYPLSSITDVLEAEGYIALTSNKEKVTTFYPMAPESAIYEVKLPILANTTSILVLFQGTDSTIIDEICYSSTWHAPSIKNKKGVALERVDPHGETQDPENWTSAATSTGYGTPGYANSQYKAKEEEIPTHLETPVLREDGTYGVSYQLDQPGYNLRGEVYNLAGSKVAILLNQELAGTQGTFIWNGTGTNGSRIHTGLYIISIELYHPTGKRKQYKKVFLMR